MGQAGRAAPFPPPGLWPCDQPRWERAVPGGERHRPRAQGDVIHPPQLTRAEHLPESIPESAARRASLLPSRSFHASAASCVSTASSLLCHMRGTHEIRQFLVPSGGAAKSSAAETGCKGTSGSSAAPRPPPPPGGVRASSLHSRSASGCDHFWKLFLRRIYKRWRISV